MLLLENLIRVVKQAYIGIKPKFLKYCCKINFFSSSSKIKPIQDGTNSKDLPKWNFFYKSFQYLFILYSIIYK